MPIKSTLLALDGDDSILSAIAQSAAPYYRALTTRDPRRFLAWLEETADVAAVLTEHVLQTASGVALLESARTMRPNARRVLLTTYHDLASIVDGLHSGAIQHVVQKPFTGAELLSAIAPHAAAANAAPRRASA